MHIRFRKSFASYEQGKGYNLPEELAQSYLKAGVAEVVDHVPPAVEVAPEPAPEAAVSELDVRDEPKHKRKSKHSEVKDADVSTAADGE